MIDESLDIMHWALAHHDPEHWLDRIDVELIADKDGAFKYHLDRYKYPQRHGSDAAVHRATALHHLIQLEQRLAATPFLCGAAQGFTDAALMPFVRQFAQTDSNWFSAQPLPALQAWLRAR